MHQVAAQVWNEIAKTQDLVSDFGKETFHLPETELDSMLEQITAQLEAKGIPAPVRVAYLTVAPLLAEPEAIAAFVRENPQYLAALPNVEDVGEAVILAAKEYRLSEPQKKQLQSLLNILR